jgi:hypothetical protein
MSNSNDWSRRDVLAATATAATLAGAPEVIRAQAPLTLGFRTIPDPDGWHPSLRLKGDWLVFEISDGVLSGYGEASHSRDDEGCKQAAVDAFARHYANFDLSLESLQRKETEIAQLAPDFVTATAYSGLNQALYDLLAKREQVPVWRLFANTRGYASLPLYTTINRAHQLVGYRRPRLQVSVGGAVDIQLVQNSKTTMPEVRSAPDTASPGEGCLDCRFYPALVAREQRCRRVTKLYQDNRVTPLRQNGTDDTPRQSGTYDADRSFHALRTESKDRGPGVGRLRAFTSCVAFLTTSSFQPPAKKAHLWLASMLRTQAQRR